MYEAHLDVCPGCERYVEQIRETITALGHISSDNNLSTEAQTGLLDAFRAFRHGPVDPPGTETRRVRRQLNPRVRRESTVRHNSPHAATRQAGETGSGLATGRSSHPSLCHTSEVGIESKAST
jgi:anti-sigma factor RsiW